MRVALLSCNAQAGDAIGNQVAEKLAFFRQHAAEVRVFLESDLRLHPALQPYSRVVPSAEPRGECWRFLRSADLVVVEFGQYYSLLSLLPLLAGARPRVLIDYHGITPPELWGAHNREALVKGLQHRGLAWAADATLTHSGYTQSELLRLTGLPSERVPRLGLPVDRNVFHPGKPALDLRRQLGLMESRLLLFVGRLAPNKRPSLLVEVLPLLADLTPAVHAVIVGDSGDLYQAEAQRCLTRARELGLADRLHLVGPKTAGELRDFYRAADVLVVPSLWESFCLPVVEAMACGLPVVAARSTALPETVAGAGLTFTPDDPADLARQLRRVLVATPPVQPPVPPQPRYRVAVVAPRFGDDLASGVEASLRTVAQSLQAAGCTIEVLTTCARAVSDPANVLPPGAAVLDGLPVRRFPVDPMPPQSEQAAGVHPLQSTALLDYLADRAAALDAILVGPYLFALTVEVTERWPERTLLVPCFHDEPAARQGPWPRLYEGVAGILYHSAAEQRFAERELGINHPGSSVVGTWLPPVPPGGPARGQALAGGAPYVLYCGRLAAEKNVPLLIEYARRFCAEHAGPVRFVFTGTGAVPLPTEPWAVDLGVVATAAQRDLLAGAVALVQLSTRESLSLAALEAWSQGAAVIGHQDCAVLADHIEQGGGGRLVGDYDSFAAALAELLDNPAERERLGRQGHQYVQAAYGAAAAFQERLLVALADMRRGLAERMRERGLARAEAFDRVLWRRQFGALVENLLHQAPRDDREDLHVRARSPRCTAAAGAGSMLLAVRVHNRGSRVAVAEGPGRTVLGGVVVDDAGRVVGAVEPPVALPALLLPGRALAAALPVNVPDAPGQYQVHLWARRIDRIHETPIEPQTPPLGLVVESDAGAEGNGGCRPILDEVQAALVEADRCKHLPEDYNDVTQGLFAGWKKRIKGKLLGNFKKAYVDVLSRQQSACNQQLVATVQALVECCATLDHAVRSLQERVDQLENRQPAEVREVAVASGKID